MYRWRIYNSDNNYTEVWDRLDHQWEASNQLPDGSLQYVLEDDRLDAIFRFRRSMFKIRRVAGDVCAFWSNLPPADKRTLLDMINGS